MKKATLVICTLLLTGFPLFSADLIHVIRKGETLYSLSRTYSVSVDDIIKANGITDPSKLTIGMEIKIPAVYVVEKGDTYYSLAKEYGVTIQTLYSLNNVTEPGLLKIGDRILVPAALPVETAVTETEVTAVLPDERVVETVIQNDTSKPFFWPHEGQRSKLSGKLEGLQFDGKAGDTIRSVCIGKVVWVGPYRGYNKIIFIQTMDDYIYGYGGNNDILVKVGDHVEPGTEIGRLGINPHEGKARMFFFVYRDGVAVDPYMAPR